jgi:hypothetical protein
MKSRTGVLTPLLNVRFRPEADIQFALEKDEADIQFALEKDVFRYET